MLEQVDGYTWHAGAKQPYTTLVETTIGQIIVSTRERPKLLFDKAGQMTHLINGVSGAAQCEFGGPPSACTNCKLRFWDYTLIAPLDISLIEPPHPQRRRLKTEDSRVGMREDQHNCTIKRCPEDLTGSTIGGPNGTNPCQDLTTCVRDVLPGCTSCECRSSFSSSAGANQTAKSA